MGKNVSTSRVTIDSLNNEGVLNLLEAILDSLYTDFCSAYNACRANPWDEKTRLAFIHIKQIICSKHIMDMTGINGFDVVQQLEEKCNKQYAIYGRAG